MPVLTKEEVWIYTRTQREYDIYDDPRRETCIDPPLSTHQEFKIVPTFKLQVRIKTVTC